MYKIEYLGKGFIELGGLGDLEKGKPIECLKAIAEEFSKDKRFKVFGLSEAPTKKGVKDGK